jgi:hypothetical protein
MRDQHARANAVEQSDDGIRGDLEIERPRAGRHLPKILIERFGIAGKLNTRIVVGPDADAKSVEPALVVRRGADRRGLCGAPGATAAWLIDQIDAVLAAQKDVLKPFAPIWCGFPGLGKLADAMPEHQRQRLGPTGFW